MRLFCLCTAREVVDNNDEGFRVSTYSVGDLDAGLFDERKGDVLLPEHPMKQSTGHCQFLADRAHIGDNVKPGERVRQHFPNVDIHRCEKCGAGVAVQG